MKKPYPGNMFCPCGASKKYKACCQPKEIQYFLGPKGKVTKVLPLSAADRAAYEVELARFVEVNGRQPTEQEDRVLRASHFEDVKTVIARDMQASGMSPAAVYAFEKTGLLVTRDNRDQVSPEELKRWEDAIEEYEVGQLEL